MYTKQNPLVGYRGWLVAGKELSACTMPYMWKPHQPASSCIWAWKQKSLVTMYGNVWGAVNLWGKQHGSTRGVLCFEFGYPKEFWYMEDDSNWKEVYHYTKKSKVLKIAERFGVEAIPLPEEVILKQLEGVF